MAEEFEDQDLSGAVFWGVDMTGARFRDVNMTGITISHAWLVNSDIDALIDRVTINGVDVTEYVNAHDRWYPLRAMLRPTDPDGMRAAWQALEREWAATIQRAHLLTEARLHDSVDGQWSFVQTLRHLVFAMDKWFTCPILGDSRFQSVGLPNSGSADFDWPGLDRDAAPSFGQALGVYTERSAQFGGYLATVSATDFDREIEVLENGTVPLCEGLYTVFEEAFHHHRYALRDLARIEEAGTSTAESAIG